MSETLVSAPRALLAPVDDKGLAGLAARGKANPAAVVTLKACTICEGKFRNLTYIRTLAPHVIDEPPHLLGDDTAPNPSEAILAALGSCLSVGVQANAVARGIRLRRLEVQLEGDINVTAVWGVGDLAPKPLGFTAVRATFVLEADASQAALEDLVKHANAWSPVANTLRNPVAVDVRLAK
ncbi:MAG: OsmC family protein [Acidiferrobacter sp.]